MARIPRTADRLIVTALRGLLLALLVACSPSPPSESASQAPATPPGPQPEASSAPATPTPAVPDGDEARPQQQDPRPEREVEDVEAPSTQRRVRVYLLAGQSNMNGHGFLNRLSTPWPDHHTLPVRIHWDQPGRRWDVGKPRALKPLGPASLISGRFGPELSLGKRLASQAPGERLVLLKYAMHWTSLSHDWRPGPKRRGPMYRRFLHIAHQGLEAIRAEGDEPEVVAMFWMQGERDAAEKHSARHYRRNLERFIHQVRADLSAPEMLFVVGQISGPKLPRLQEVRAAQAEVARTTPGVLLVDTEGLPLMFDRLHFNADGQWGLGERFAAALERD